MLCLHLWEILPHFKQLTDALIHRFPRKKCRILVRHVFPLGNADAVFVPFGRHLAVIDDHADGIGFILAFEKGDILGLVFGSAVKAVDALCALTGATAKAQKVVDHLLRHAELGMRGYCSFCFFRLVQDGKLLPRLGAVQVIVVLDQCLNELSCLIPRKLHLMGMGEIVSEIDLQTVLGGVVSDMLLTSLFVELDEGVHRVHTLDILVFLLRIGFRTQKRHDCIFALSQILIVS